MNILPVLKGWRRDYDYRPNLVLQPGGTPHRIPSPSAWQYPGYLRWLYVRSNSPYVTIEHNLYAEKTHAFSYYQAFLDGIWLPPPDGQLYLTAYNAVTNRYVTLAAPQPPIEFPEGAIVTISLPNINPVTGAAITANAAIDVGWFAILITDEEKFKLSMRAVLGQRQTIEEFEYRKARVQKAVEEAQKYGKTLEMPL